jgi:hypothetical protein
VNNVVCDIFFNKSTKTFLKQGKVRYYREQVAFTFRPYTGERLLYDYHHDLEVVAGKQGHLYSHQTILIRQKGVYHEEQKLQNPNYG